ncbi:MAG: type III-A CRISPR-associated protein Cas10/Csm1 [Anaerolineae bacterium]
MEEQDDIYRIALAGLLHDIGKFAQRAGWMKGPHAEVGGEFVRQFVPQAWREGLYPVMGHHAKPEDRATKIIALADWLSAGERVTEEEEHPRPLLSIFCSLVADGQRVSEAYWPLQDLRMEESVVFPIRPAPEAEGIAQSYRDLWEKFQRDISVLRDAHAADGRLPVYLESVLLLLQRYTWCIPSAYYRSLPDISLYDHSRMTAALAACLTEKDENALDRVLDALRGWRDPQQPLPSVLEETEVALLVGGDISGVQDFVYTITAQGATSALRGRSFYLQLLAEAVAHYVLRQLGLPVTNLIYQGGGHFYLLARPSDKGRLKEIRQEVSRILLAHHWGDLYLALASVPLRAADFYGGRISSRWAELGRELQGAKGHRFAELGEELATLFKPQGHGGNEEAECQVCGREHPGTKRDEDVRKCPQCRSYEDLGESLRRARYLWMAERDISPATPTEPGGWREVLGALGLEAGVVQDLSAVPSSPHRLRRILALKDEAMANLRPDAHTVVGRRLLVNVTPIITQEEIEPFRKRIAPLPVAGAVKPFEVMEAQSTGISRLGVLRMDVDNLGTLFAEGLGERATLSRVAALSFAISLFFEGWVEVLAERIGKETGVDRLYSIYSGGDDLFFVGSWDAVAELARAIRADFSRFAADHPGVHASAGIALVGGKYPLYQAAKEAGEAEQKAKQLRWWDENGREHTKDAVAFLGQGIPWRKFGLESCDSQARTAHSLAHRLHQMVQEKDVPRSLLQMLIRLQEMYTEAMETRRRHGEGYNRNRQEQVVYGPWMWRGYYFLKRMARRYKDQPAIGESVDELAEGLHGDNFRAIEWIGLAARWAELLGRETTSA